MEELVKFYEECEEKGKKILESRQLAELEVENLSELEEISDSSSVELVKVEAGSEEEEEEEQKEVWISEEGT